MAMELLVPGLLVMTLGAVTLLFGRRLYWVFVGLGGFMTGLGLATTYLSDWNIFLALLIGIVAGVAVGALAIVAQRPLLSLGAFLGVGFLALTICLMFGIVGPWNVIIAAIVGAIAAVAMFITFDWALIVNSSLSGAGAIVGGAAALMPFLSGWGGVPATILAAALAAAGILFQARSYEGARSTPLAGSGLTGRAG